MAETVFDDDEAAMYDGKRTEAGATRLPPGRCLAGPLSAILVISNKQPKLQADQRHVVRDCLFQTPWSQRG